MGDERKLTENPKFRQEGLVDMGWKGIILAIWAMAQCLYFRRNETRSFKIQVMQETLLGSSDL